MVASASAGLREHESDVEALFEVKAGCASEHESARSSVRGRERGKRGCTIAVTLEPQTQLLLLQPHTSPQTLRHTQPVLGNIPRQLEMHASQPRAELRVDPERGRDLVDYVVHVTSLDARIGGGGLGVAVHRVRGKDDCARERV